MIELYDKTQFDFIEDKNLHDCVTEALELFESYGNIYGETALFAIIENKSELYNEIKLSHANIILPSISDGLLEQIELTEYHSKFDIFEIVILLHADFGVSLFLKCKENLLLNILKN